jgi:hypothetical protein
MERAKEIAERFPKEDGLTKITLVQRAATGESQETVTVRRNSNIFWADADIAILRRRFLNYYSGGASMNEQITLIP